MRSSKLVLWTTCVGLLLLKVLNLWFLSTHPQFEEWKDDVHLSSNRHSELEMKPLDDYVKYLELDEMSPEECVRNGSRITNTSLSYLLDLPTPCSTGEEHCVLSFALWCDGIQHGLHSLTAQHTHSRCQRYLSHLPNLHGWKDVFKGWQIRLYTDESVPAKLLEPYQEFVSIIAVNASLKGAGTWGSMWRLLPLWDDTNNADSADVADNSTHGHHGQHQRKRKVDRLLTRDLDSVPLVRDWATTYEWIRLQAPSYRFADHAHHYSHPIMAGALGLWINRALDTSQRHELLRKYQNLVRIMNKYNDQEWYEKELWPLLKQNIVSFDVHHCKEYPNWHPYPVPHSNCDWIMGGPDHLFARSSIVDPVCRHPNHSSWKWG